MQKKKLYIHIGCEKTGTTSIQEALSNNRKKLLQQGLLYPEFGTNSTGHFSLPASIHHLDHPSHTSPGYYDIKNVTPESEWSKFIELCISNKTLNIAISSEHFSSRVGQKGLVFIKEKLDLLTPFFDIEFIIILRRQDLFLESSYSTVIKSGGAIEFNEYVESTWELQNRYNFKRLIGLWQSVFQNCIFHINEYTHVTQHSSLIDYFCTIFDINPSELDALPDDKNTSWSKRMIEIGRLCNKGELLRLLGNRRLEFLEAIASSEYMRNDKERYHLSSFQKQRMLMFYYESNREIEESFFNGERLLTTECQNTLAAATSDNKFTPNANVTKVDVLSLLAEFVLYPPKP